MKCSKTILMFVVMSMVFVSPVLAGSISIAVTATSYSSDDEAFVNLTLQNRGDEAAEDVSISLLLPDGFTSDSVFVGRLDPNIDWKGFVPLNITDNILPGVYPIVIQVQYRDLNGYPFSSVSRNSITYQETSYSDVSGVIEDLDLVNEGNVVVSLRNRGDSPIDATVRLYLPKEITTYNEEMVVTVDAKGEKDVSFEVSNFGAITGSVYYVLAGIEYEDGVHYSSFASGLVSISETSQVAGFDYNWLIYILIGLVIVFILYQFKGRIGWGKKKVE